MTIAMTTGGEEWDRDYVKRNNYIKCMALKGIQSKDEKYERLPCEKLGKRQCNCYNLPNRK